MGGRGPGAAVLAVASALAAVPARASSVDVTTTTLVQGRVAPVEGEERTVVPILQAVDLRARDLANPFLDELSVSLSAWGRVDPVEKAGLLGNAADLDLAYLAGTALDRQLSLKLGRHFVFGGVARARQVDGASVEVRVAPGFGISAFGGVAVLPRFSAGKGDATFGGRLFYKASIDAEVGASFLQLWDRGETAQQLAGIDARYVLRSLTFGGFASWSVVAGRFAEGDLSVTWQPAKSLQATIDARRSAPDLFLPRTSILSVFAAETRDGVGGDVQWTPLRLVSLGGEYHYLRFGADGADTEGRPLADEAGHEAALRIQLRPHESLVAGLRGRWLETPGNGLLEGRLFATWRATAALGVALDLDVFRFRNPINAHGTSYVGSVSLTWALGPRWMAAVTGLASVTPYFERRFEGVARLVYNFSTRTREVVP